MTKIMNMRLEIYDATTQEQIEKIIENALNENGINCSYEWEELNWIPVSSGNYPEEMENVQVTFLGYNDHMPHCEEFAYHLGGKWYWVTNDDPVRVEIIAWRRHDGPYMPSITHHL